MSDKMCRHCRRLISGQDYRVVGYETNDARFPENVYVHVDCLPGYTNSQQRHDLLATVATRSTPNMTLGSGSC